MSRGIDVAWLMVILDMHLEVSLNLCQLRDGSLWMLILKQWLTN